MMIFPSENREWLLWKGITDAEILRILSTYISILRILRTNVSIQSDINNDLDRISGQYHESEKQYWYSWKLIKLVNSPQIEKSNSFIKYKIQLFFI